MMAALWTRDDAVTATGGTPLGRPWTASGVAIDSRAVQPGDLFVALPGERTDGHDHVGQALRAGAVAALVVRAPAGLADDARLLVVPDPLAALVALGHAARARSSARIAAVTGSVGKTGSKEMLAAALAAYGPTVASKGNLNNHIGAPLSLARLDRQAAFAVFELGMNHPDEIRPLARMVRPHAALITNVEMVHAGFFTGIEQIADAKAEILEGIEGGGAAVLNRDNGQFERLAAHARRLAIARVVTFGTGAPADARLLDAASSADGTRVTAEIDGRRLSWTVGGIGRHWAINSLGVAATLHALGLDPSVGTAALAGVSAMRGRGGQVRLDLPDGPVTLIDESYNASPPAMRAALAVFAGTHPAAAGRRIVVLGDMLELGATAAAAHRGLAEAVTAARPDAVFLVGPEMRALAVALPATLVAGHAERSEDIAAAVAAAVTPGDVVLVKGSLGMRMKAIVTAIEALAASDRRAANGG